MSIFIIMILGIGLILGPMAAASAGYPLGGAASATCVLFGSVVTLLAGVALVFTRLYQKTKASEAFVRTGSGGVKVIRDGGAIIIPVLHELKSI